MMIDPLGIPFMQKALGQGQLSEQDLRQLLQQQGSVGGAQGMLGGMGGAGPSSPQLSQNLGTGPAQPPPQFQGLMGSSDQPGNGPNPMIMQMLNSMGGPGSFNTSQGPIPAGVNVTPQQGGGGIGGGAILRMLGGK
jgi:hypothetical protein